MEKEKETATNPGFDACLLLGISPPCSGHLYIAGQGVIGAHLYTWQAVICQLAFTATVLFTIFRLQTLV